MRDGEKFIFIFIRSIKTEIYQLHAII